MASSLIRGMQSSVIRRMESNLERNACGGERIARLLGGLALVAWGTRSGTRHNQISVGRLLATYAGAELLVTAATRFCPANFVLGRNSCEPGRRGRSRLASIRNR